MLSINTLSYGQFDACFHADLSLHLRGAWNEESVCMNSMHTPSDNDIRALVHSNTRCILQKDVLSSFQYIYCCVEEDCYIA